MSQVKASEQWDSLQEAKQRRAPMLSDRSAELERRLLILALVNSASRAEVVRLTDGHHFESSGSAWLMGILKALPMDVNRLAVVHLGAVEWPIVRFVAELMNEANLDREFDVLAEARSTARVLQQVKERAASREERQSIGNDYMRGGSRWREELAERAAKRQTEDMDRIMLKAEVVQAVGLGIGSINSMISQGRFPKPVALGNATNRLAWRASEIKQWIATREPVTDKPKGKS